MHQVTLASKGKLTIPIEIRQQMQLKEGDQLNATYDAQTQTISMSKVIKPADLTK